MISSDLSLVIQVSWAEEGDRLGQTWLNLVYLPGSSARARTDRGRRRWILCNCPDQLFEPEGFNLIDVFGRTEVEELRIIIVKCFARRKNPSFRRLISGCNRFLNWVTLISCRNPSFQAVWTIFLVLCCCGLMQWRRFQRHPRSDWISQFLLEVWSLLFDSKWTRAG